MPKTHHLKIRLSCADAVLNKEKTFEIRPNDRDYHEGDIICYQVIDDNTKEPVEHPLNGKEFVITYLMADFGVQQQLCAFGIRKIAEPEPEPEACSHDACPINFDEISERTIYSYAGMPKQQRPIRPVVDPNTQCVDCRYGTPISTPDGLAYTIRCEVYDGRLRSPQDTCLADIVDLNSFTADREKKD